MEKWDSPVKEDHEALKIQVGTLKAALEKTSADEDRRDNLRRFIRVMGPDLELHLKKEEEVLFPALERLLGGKPEEIALLREQHGQLRALLRYIAHLECECGCKDPASEWKEIATAGQRFVDLLEEHEKNEETQLVRVLELSLKPQELLGLAREFQQMVWKTRREGL